MKKLLFWFTLILLVLENFGLGFFNLPLKARAAAPADIIINEIMFNPTNSPNGSEIAREWFELYNRTAEDIDINGFQIADWNNRNAPHIIDNGGPLIILAGDFLVIGQSADQNINGGAPVDYAHKETQAQLNNDGDAIFLWDAQNIEIDRVDYRLWSPRSILDGHSLALTDPGLDNDDSDNWFEENIQTYGDGDFGSPGEVNVDTTPPTSNILFPLEGQFYNSDPASWTGIISGTATDIPSTGISEVKVQIKRAIDNFTWDGSEFTNGDNWNSSTLSESDSDGDQIYDWTYDFPAINFDSDGQYTISSRAKDGVLNEESTNTVTFTYDNTLPQITSVLLNQDDLRTNNPQVQVSVVASDNLALDTMQLSEDGINYQAVQPFATAFSYTFIAGDGLRNLYVKVIDKAGNSNFAYDTIELDTTPPQTTITLTPPNPSGSADATFTFNSSEGGSTFECQLDNGGFSSCASPKTYVGLADGSHTFDVRAIDEASNVDPSPASFNWTIDTTAPLLPTLTKSPLDQTIEPGTPLVFEGTAEPLSKIIISVESPIITGQTTADINGFWRITILTTSLSEGEHKVKIAVIDTLGNQSVEFALGQFTIKKKEEKPVEPAPTVVTPAPTVAEVIPIGGVPPAFAAEETPVEEVAPAPEKIVPPTEVAPEPLVEQGKIKPAEAERPTDYTRLIITLAILIVAAGAAVGGYYGYEWWLKRGPKPPQGPPPASPNQTTRW